MTEESKKKQHKEDKPLEKMTVKDLKEIALEIPHDHTAIAVSDMKKDELIAFIKQSRGIVDEEPVKKKKKTVKIKVLLTKPEIKAKIKKLRQEKKSAQTADEKKKTKALRHRISRLKKQSRKTA
ncbi:MAG TPA: transcription termination factor Rho [Deltaproteobacteria bacterium]|nr:transcription termination factor Rho [Deltaproteobacteria bacterium]